MGFIGVSFHHNKGTILMEFCEGRDLHSALRVMAAGGRDRLFSWWEQGKTVALDVARAVNYIHQQHVLHLDSECGWEKGLRPGLPACLTCMRTGSRRQRSAALATCSQVAQRAPHGGGHGEAGGMWGRAREAGTSSVLLCGTICSLWIESAVACLTAAGCRLFLRQAQYISLWVDSPGGNFRLVIRAAWGKRGAAGKKMMLRWRVMHVLLSLIHLPLAPISVDHSL